MIKNVPKPGRPVRGSRSGRPIMALVDLLGRRWVLRIVWELRETPHLPRAAAGMRGLSPSVLNQRLGELRETLLVELKPEGYALTTLGDELLTQLMPLTGWAEKWAKAIR